MIEKTTHRKDDSIVEPHRAQIEAPVLVHVANDDIVTPAYFSEELHARIRNSSLHAIEKGGHFCPQTMAGEFRETVVSFLLEHG